MSFKITKEILTAGGENLKRMIHANAATIREIKFRNGKNPNDRNNEMARSCGYYDVDSEFCLLRLKYLFTDTPDEINCADGACYHLYCIPCAEIIGLTDDEITDGIFDTCPGCEFDARIWWL